MGEQATTGPHIPERRASSDLPPWVPTLLTRIVLTTLLTLAAWWVARELTGFLINVLASLFLSFAFEPAVRYMARRGLRRGLATAIVFVVALTFAIGFFSIMLPPILGQGANLVGQVPEWIEDYGPRLEEALGVELSLDALAANFGDVGALIERYAATVTGQVAGVASATIGLLVNLLTVGLFTFYLLADGPRIRRRLFGMFPPHRQAEVVRIWELAISKTGGYVYSRVVLATISAAVTAAFLALLGVDDALAMGIWVGVISQFVPVLGTYIAAVVPIFVAFIDSPVKAVWVLVFLVGYQQVENVIIAPRVTARTMSLHPAIGFGSAIVGINLLGALGAIIALPTAAIVQAFVSAVMEEHPVKSSWLTSDLIESEEAEQLAAALGPPPVEEE